MLWRSRGADAYGGARPPIGFRQLATVGTLDRVSEFDQSSARAVAPSTEVRRCQPLPVLSVPSCSENRLRVVPAVLGHYEVFPSFTEAIFLEERITPDLIKLADSFLDGLTTVRSRSRILDPANRS